MDKKWIRNYPTCNEKIFYTQNYNRTQANKINSECSKCKINKQKIHIPCYPLNINEMMMWVRICPQCKTPIHHKREQNCKVYDRQRKICKLCSSKGKNNPFYGKTHSIKTKLDLANKWKEKYKRGYINPVKGKINSKEHRLKISIANTGKNNAFYKIGFMKGKHHSEETKEKLRIITLNKIKYRLGKTFHNPIACQYFDKLNKEKGWNLKHAMNGGEHDFIGYSVDAYDIKKNIVVEYDEPFHYYYGGVLKQKDIIRMNNIIKHLKCKFYRYDEKRKILKEYGKSYL